MKKNIYILKSKIISYYIFLKKVLKFILSSIGFKNIIPNQICYLNENEIEIDEINFSNNIKYSKKVMIANEWFLSDKLETSYVEKATLHSLKKHYVFGNNGLVGNEKCIYYDHIVEKPYSNLNGVIANMSIFYPKPIVLKKAVLISSRWFDNYYHFNFDLLTKFDLLDKFKISNYPIIIPNSRYLQHDIIKKIIFSYKMEIIVIDSKKNYCVDELKIIYQPNLKVTSRKVDFLRKIMDSNVSLTTNKTYISRKFAKTRRIKNETQLCDYLISHGFKVYYFEDLKIDQQISIIKSSKIIVTAHGAALTNIVHCREGTTIIELFNSNKLNPFFMEIARYLDLEYYYYVDQIADIDIYVDLEMFDNYFFRVLNQ